jgi:alkylated DNA repair protein (DNA oxidative demethylase)
MRAYALVEAPSILEAAYAVAHVAPFRHMQTARGWEMSVAVTNCGQVGWVSDRRGYRYDCLDPESGQPWPAMSLPLKTFGTRAAREAGYLGFEPDACLINCYRPGARLSLHQDRNEIDFSQPVVSISLGLPATFLWGGSARADKPRRIRLEHGDVVVWGGPASLAFHGVDTLKAGDHPATGETRINLTFRRALAGS